MSISTQPITISRLQPLRSPAPVRPGSLPPGEPVQGTPATGAPSPTRLAERTSPVPFVSNIFTVDALELIDDACRRAGWATPRPYAMARDAMRRIIRNLTGLDADPDRLYLNKFRFAQSSSTAFTGWEHRTPPTSSIPLTKMMFENFGAQAQLLTSSEMSVNAGIYTVGAGEDYYGAGNDFPLPLDKLREAIWADDFQTRMLDQVVRFWGQHWDDTRIIAKAHFISSAIAAREEGTLSPEAFSLLMRGAGTRLPATMPLGTATLAEKTSPERTVNVLAFDINGYPSSDILRFVGKDGLTVLYAPGLPSIFHEFASEVKLREWVVEASRSPERRQALQRSFSLYNQQDGIWHTGVANGLEKLSTGEWTSGIDTADRRYTGDIFEAFCANMRKRALTDVDTLIRSDSEINEEMWLESIRMLNNLLWPVALFVPEAAVPLSFAGMGSELGLELRQAYSGDTYDERHAGAYAAALTLGSTVVGIALGMKGIKGEVGEAEPAAPNLRAGDEPAGGPAEGPAGGSAGGSVPGDTGTALPVIDPKYAVDPAILSQRTPDAAGIYQVEDRFYIRITPAGGQDRFFEIRSDFKTGYGYVNVIDPETRRTVAILHSDGAEGWVMLPGLPGGMERPAYRGGPDPQAMTELSRRGYLMPSERINEVDFEPIEDMKERVDATRHKLEDLGREFSDDGKRGDYRIVYRVDDLTPEALLQSSYYRPSRDFIVVDRMLPQHAVIGSATVKSSNTVLEMWDRSNPEPMYQYSIVLDEGERSASYADRGGNDVEGLDEVHFPPPPVKNVYLLDSTDPNARRAIQALAASPSVNTSFGVPLQAYEDYRAGRLSLDEGARVLPPSGSGSPAATSSSGDSVTSLDTTRAGGQRTAQWVAMLPRPGTSRSPEQVQRPRSATI